MNATVGGATVGGGRSVSAASTDHCPADVVAELGRLKLATAEMGGSGAELGVTRWHELRQEEIPRSPWGPS